MLPHIIYKMTEEVKITIHTLRKLTLLDKLDSDMKQLKARIRARRGYILNNNQKIEASIDEAVLKCVREELKELQKKKKNKWTLDNYE